MRVIAGTYRSRLLVAPPGSATRPTSDRLRETLFNVLTPRIDGSVFADLYAGSGANGIEALSRGAEHVYFVENSRAALNAVHANLKSLGITSGSTIEPRAVAAFLRKHAELETPAKFPQPPSGGANRKLDVVFLDPPYDDGDAYATTLALMGGECASALSPHVIVVAEHRHKQPPADHYASLTRYRLLKQGDVALSFYRF